jgi:hypothetical protein
MASTFTFKRTFKRNYRPGRDVELCSCGNEFDRLGPSYSLPDTTDDEGFLQATSAAADHYAHLAMSIANKRQLQLISIIIFEDGSIEYTYGGAD